MRLEIWSKVTRQIFPGGRWPSARPSGGDAAARAGLRHAAWLAVLALLLQMLLPDLGMAARARIQAREHAVAQPLHHAHADGGQTAPVPAPKPKPKHAHDTACPFCLALASHALEPATGCTLAPPHVRGSEGAVAAGGIVPALSFLTCLRPRAPPYAGRA